MNRIPASKRRGGFTIVETLVALSIMALIMVAIGFALQNASQATRTNALVAESRQRAMNGLNYTLSAIRRAKDIYLLDDAGNPLPNATYATKLETVRIKNLSNWADVAWAIFDLDTKDGHSYLRVVSEDGTSNPALDSVVALRFDCIPEKDGSRRQVTVKMSVRIADPLAPNDTSKSRILNLEATEVARGAIKP